MGKALRRYDFSERLADILRESRRDLRYRVTLLIAAGLLSAGRRGPGSPPVTPADAADLLIGVMAAPQQVHTVEAVRCYRAFEPTAVAAEPARPEVVVGARVEAEPSAPPPLLPARLGFGEALARLLDHAARADGRATLARDLFGVWVSRGFPVAAIQLAAWSEGRRAIVTQRYEPPPGARPPAWLDPDRGGAADPGLLHSVFLSAGKLLDIGALTTPQHERTTPMIDLGPAIGHIANLADLARRQRDRRPWQKFLKAAASAETVAESLDAKPGRLVEVAEFGSNPGNLRMMTYVPAELAPDPALVVVLHGCTQNAASYDTGTGWTTLADRHGFAVLLPEQRRTNNPLRCFNWFKAGDRERDGGEPRSIVQMVERAIADYGIDRRRVFVTGLSAGGAMTSVMLATHPEVFAGGAIIAGVPYLCADGLQDAFDVIFQGRSLPAAEWGDKVRQASAHRGPWPRVSVWHGAADSTVKPVNAEETVKQWLDVHGLASTAAVATPIGAHTRRVWRDGDGRDVVEHVIVAGMAHGAPIDPHGEDGCGTVQPFIHDAGLSSTRSIAAFWGLTEHRCAEVPVQRRRPVPEPAAAPVQPEPKPAPAFAADATGPAGAGEGAGAGAGAGVDLSTLLGKALEAARQIAGGREAPGAAADPAAPRGLDVSGLIAKSLEAASLFTGGREGGPGPGGIGTARGIDLQSILTRSFEAAGLLRTGQGQATPAGGELAGSGWQGQGWQRLADATDGRSDGPVLFGYASSGIGCDVGRKVCAASRSFTLGPRPTLRYVRKLDLRAAVNILTAASFTVLVDGIAVDEVNVVGMDYAEAEWTPRAGIDLTRFAGRTVTVTLEVTANSNICLEVFAKAWIEGLAVEDGRAG